MPIKQQLIEIYTLTNISDIIRRLVKIFRIQTVKSMRISKNKYFCCIIIVLNTVVLFGIIVRNKTIETFYKKPYCKNSNQEKRYFFEKPSHNLKLKINEVLLIACIIKYQKYDG